MDAKICLFCCATSYDQAEISRSIDRQGLELKVVSIPCSGKLDILYLTKAFDTGADGVVVMVCPEGECRYLEGNLRARKRVEAVEKLLEETSLGTGRITVVQLGENGVPRALREVKDFCLKIKDIVRNARPAPVKG
jgi:F420-non-reducing hydrogenase iron-sulfur subunit